MTARDAFKVAFLRKCAADGLTADEIAARAANLRARAEKAAGLEDLVTKPIGAAVDAGKGLVGGAFDLGKGVVDVAGGYGLPLALAAPVVAGGAAGYGLAKFRDIDDTDVDDVKDREVIDEYRRQSEHLKRQQALRDYYHAAAAARPPRRL